MASHSFEDFVYNSIFILSNVNVNQENYYDYSVIISFINPGLFEYQMNSLIPIGSSYKYK